MTRAFAVLLATLLAGCVPLEDLEALAGAVAGPPPSGGDYLPIAPGARWVLRNPGSPEPVEMRVLSVSGDRYRLRYDNPWIDSEMTLRRVGSRHELLELSIGGQSYPMPAGSVLYDFGAPRGSTWSSAVGTHRVMAVGETRKGADGRTYANCVRIRETSSDGQAIEWSFAPGVGYVGMGPPGVVFALDAGASSVPAAGTALAPALSGASPAASSRTSAAPRPKGNRKLSIAITLDSSMDFAKAFQVAKSAGMDESGGLLNFDWNLIEPSPGKYVDPEDGALAFANSFYPKHRMPVTLTIAPIQTNQHVVPSDLKRKSWDDPELIARFVKMLDFVFAQVPDLQIKGLSIGNEVDALLGSSSRKYQEYARFASAVRTALKSRRPGLQVGVKATFGGLTQVAPGPLQSLNAEMDAVMVTYYPLNANMTVRPPSVVHGDFQQLARLYPGRPIHMLEAGYPSGAATGSSPDRQAEFIREFFRAWDSHTSQVTIVDFTWLHDVPQSVLEHFSGYYGSSDPTFLSYLGTLGLRTRDGRDKPAFVALREEAKARGW